MVYTHPTWVARSKSDAADVPAAGEWGPSAGCPPPHSALDRLLSGLIERASLS